MEPLPVVELLGFAGVLVDPGALAVKVGVVAEATDDDDLREQVGAATANGSTSRDIIGRINFMTFQTYDISGESR